MKGFEKMIRVCIGVCFISLILSFAPFVYADEEVIEPVVVNETWVPNKAQEIMRQNPFLKRLLDRGIKLISLGNEFGFDSWLMTSGGQLQTFYTVPGQNIVLSGFLIGPNGENITAQQLGRYESLNDNAVQKELEADIQRKKELEAMSPADKLDYLVKETRGFTFSGNENKPFVYVFMTPDCRRCLPYYSALKEQFFDKGLINVQFVPVYTNEEQRKLFLSLFALDDPKAELFSFLEDPKIGDISFSSLNYNNTLSQNTAVLKNYKLEAGVPVTFYKNEEGRLQIVQDVPLDLSKIMNDMGVKK